MLLEHVKQLDGDRVTLRVLPKRDLLQWTHLYKTADISKAFGRIYIENAVDLKKFYNRIRRKIIVIGVYEIGSLDLVGEVDVINECEWLNEDQRKILGITNDEVVVEVIFGITHAYRGKGFMREPIDKVFTMLFSSEETSGVVLAVNCENDRANEFIRSLNFPMTFTKDIRGVERYIYLCRAQGDFGVQEVG